MPLDPDQVIARARAFAGRGTVYWPGAGNEDPALDSPLERLAPAAAWQRLLASPPPGFGAARRAEVKALAAEAGLSLTDPAAHCEACDCSGFVLWALGLPRQLLPARPWAEQHGWVNTDAIWRDARSASPELFEPLPEGQAFAGALLVYPKPPDHSYGHVGIVTAVDDAGRATRVLHCSADNYRRSRDAIAETDLGAAGFTEQAATRLVRYREMAR